MLRSNDEKTVSSPRATAHIAHDRCGGDWPVNAEAQSEEREAGPVSSTANPEPAIEPVSQRFPTLEEQEIVLTLSCPQAREVRVVGDFNNCCQDGTPMQKNGAGVWTVRLMLRSGQYRYRFLVDGAWREDPGASQRAPNASGQFNSILSVPLAVRTSIL